MESISPKCVKQNDCFIVCNSKNCTAFPFMCADPSCECYPLHSKCITNTKWINIKGLYQNKLQKSTVQLNEYFTHIQEIYKNILKQIDTSYEQTKNIFQNFELSQLQKELYEKLEQRKYLEFTGQLMNQLEAKLLIEIKQFQNLNNIKELKQQIQRQTQKLIKMLRDLTKIQKKVAQKQDIKQINQSLKISSKITQDVGAISTFFQNKKICSINLLYRASENNFQVKKFREKCDGKKNTITIIKTQFGNVIGGYTPLAWNRSSNGKYQKDDSKESFTFSLTHKHQLKLIEGRQQYSIYHRNNYGPIFGAGNDLWIYDKANQNSNSGAYVGNSYTHSEYFYKNQESNKKFSGQTNGHQFQIEQWQVHEIIFS